jgi:hypothetical protein
VQSRPYDVAIATSLRGISVRSRSATDGVSRSPLASTCPLLPTTADSTVPSGVKWYFVSVSSSISPVSTDRSQARGRVGLRTLHANGDFDPCWDFHLRQKRERQRGAPTRFCMFEALSIGHVR